MGRRPLCRRVSFIPSITYFKPAGIPLRELEENCLAIEEVEAIRLTDLEDLEQEQCAERMNVSRTTFIRILESARKKVAEALIKGKAIRIEGGNFEMASRIFRCERNHEWEASYEELIANSSQICPTCGSAEVTPVQPVIQKRGGGLRFRSGSRTCQQDETGKGDSGKPGTL